MKTIGLCIPTIEGGVVCLQELGREAARRRTAYPAIVTHTLPYADLNNAIKSNDFSLLGPAMADSIARTARAGAELAIIPSNTVHVAFAAVAAASPIPVLSILDVAAEHCRGHGYRRVGILGTNATAQLRLYDAPLAQRGVDNVYPTPSDQEKIQSIIIHELLRGDCSEASCRTLETIAQRVGEDCDALVLGCTELPLVLNEKNCHVAVVDTTRILAHAALDEASKE